MKTPSIHLPIPPLNLLYDVQAAVHDELVHMPCLLGEPRDAIAALLRGAELVLEEGVVLRADDGEVVGHLLRRSCGVRSDGFVAPVRVSWSCWGAPR
jgi:hypothetical protein